MTPRVERATILLTFAGVTVITVVAKSLASYDPSMVWSRFTSGATATWLLLVRFAGMSLWNRDRWWAWAVRAQLRCVFESGA